MPPGKVQQTIRVDADLATAVEMEWRRMVEEANKNNGKLPSVSEAYNKALREWLNAKRAGKIQRQEP